MTFLESLVEIAAQNDIPTTRQLAILLYVCSHNKPFCTCNWIATTTGIDPSTITRATDSLVRAQLVRRYYDKGDRRKTFILPTTRGRKLAEPLLAKGAA